MPRPPARQAATARLADGELATLDDVTGPWPGRVESVDGARVHIRTTPTDAADAEPALLVHGLGGSALNWTDFAALLRPRLAIEAIDLPGHGLSGPSPRNRYTPQSHADAVIAYLEQSARGSVHLIGNSMGGAISILVAAQRPDLVRTLTLISPAVPDNRIRIFPLRHNPRMALTVVPVVGEFLMGRFNARYAPEVRAMGTIALCFADRSRYPQARLDELVAEIREREQQSWAASAMLRSLRGLATSQLLQGRTGWRTMRSIGAPSLVVWGDTDRLVAPDLAPYVAAAIPDSRLLEFEGVGHTAMMEVPEPTARAVLALLDDASGVPTTGDPADTRIARD